MNSFVNMLEDYTIKAAPFDDYEQKCLAIGEIANSTAKIIYWTEQPGGNRDTNQLFLDPEVSEQLGYLAFWQSVTNMEALTKFLNDNRGNSNPPKDPVIQEMQEALLLMPRYAQASVLDITLESRILALAETMHNLWRKQKVEDLANGSFEQEFRFLPYCLIGWNEVQRYLRNILDVMACFTELQLSLEDLERAYHYGSAIDLYVVCTSGQEDNILPSSFASLFLRVSENEISLDEELYLKFLEHCNLKKLEQQVADYGLGNMQLLKQYMQIMQDFQHVPTAPMNAEIDAALQEARIEYCA